MSRARAIGVRPVLFEIFPEPAASNCIALLRSAGLIPAGTA